MEDAVAKRLSMQKELLSRLEDLSEHLQKRANAATEEVNQLVNQTGVVEQHLRSTFNTFRYLSYHRFVQNRISEEGLTDHMKEEGRQSEAAILAQSYEEDIFPRYREALSLGLNSYRNHVQSRTSLGSVFRNGSRHGPLPHIIGSDEYIHDNSCGLVTEDSTLSEASLLDFSHAGERNDVSSSAAGGSHGTFAADLLGMEHIPKKKGQVEPMVSAASDFKAMLEAALLSSYKFYDEDSTTPSDFVSHNTTNLHAHLDHTTSTESNAVTDARLASLTSTDECHFEAGDDYPPSHPSHPVYDSASVSSTHDPEKIVADTEPSGGMSLLHDEVILSCDKQISYGSQDFHSSSMGSSQTDQVTLPDEGSSSKTDN